MASGGTPRPNVISLVITRVLSKIVAAPFRIHWPKFIMRWMLDRYCKGYPVNLEEQKKDLYSYKSIEEFFTRPLEDLKDNARPIDQEAAMVCPVDGLVEQFGEVKDGKIPQIRAKGYEFSEEEFLCHDSDHPGPGQAPPGTKRMFIVFYMDGEDYHHYHSPAMVKASHRSHVPGCLILTDPKHQRSTKNLYVKNERAVVEGTWEHGRIALCPVGTCCASDMRLVRDLAVRGNKCTDTFRCEWVGRKEYKPIQWFPRGEEVGHFKLGSTMVLVFDAPQSFEFVVELNKHYLMGQPLAKIDKRDCDGRKGQ